MTLTDTEINELKYEVSVGKFCAGFLVVILLIFLATMLAVAVAVRRDGLTIDQLEYDNMVLEQRLEACTE